jgi:hypothetical protein
MSISLGYDPANFYIWRASDDFVIYLSLQMVAQLGAHISRQASESRPPEARGILLGRTSETGVRTTVIEDFKIVARIEDQSQVDSDDAQFEIACQRVRDGSDQRAVGFFRSRRDGRLNMGQRDLETFSRLFCEPGNVALLIQTSRRGNESDAALFYWQHGGALPRDFGFGFPFDAGQLAAGHPGWRYPDPLLEPRTAWLPPLKPVEIDRSPPPHALASVSRERIRWSPLMTTAAFVAISIGALQLFTNSRPTVAAAAGNHAGLGLAATPYPHQLEIRWNRSSATIAAAQKGEMKITEAGTTQDVPFDQSQLRGGYVTYTPSTTDVIVRLEVTGSDGGTTSESIRSAAIP